MTLQALGANVLPAATLSVPAVRTRLDVGSHQVDPVLTQELQAVIAVLTNAPGASISPAVSKPPEGVSIRLLATGEEWFLREMLYQAIFTPAGEKPLPESILELPEINRYIADFGRQGDVCYIAEQQGILVGAIWSRLFSKEQKGYGFFDEQTPEISMAIKPRFRGQGIGAMLLNAITETLYEQGYKQLSLSVDKRNRAFGLYKKIGFEVVSEVGNSLTMVRIQSA